MREVRSWRVPVPSSWASAGIVDARAFRVGASETVHALSHAGPNRVRGECGVVAVVIEGEPRATWAGVEPDCRTCTAR